MILICTHFVWQFHYIMNLQFMIVIYTRFARQSYYIINTSNCSARPKNQRFSGLTDIRPIKHKNNKKAPASSLFCHFHVWHCSLHTHIIPYACRNATKFRNISGDIMDVYALSAK